jgi:two-component system, cell cycle sensor histidine kinase and response regulator CckA
MTDPPSSAPPGFGGEAPDAPYRVAFDHSLEAIVIAQDGCVQVANPATARLSGYALEELIGMPILELVHPEDHPQTFERYQRRLAGDTTDLSMVVRGLRKDSVMVWLEAHSMPVAWRGRPAVLIFIADVTDREQAKSDAAETQRMLARIAEVAPYFLFIYDYDLGRDVYINRSVAGALGYSAEEEAALGPYPFLALCHPEDLARSLEREERWHNISDGASDAVEFRLRHRSGEWRWFLSHNTPFRRDADGRVRQILGMSQDVTEKKRSEELLRRSERIESLGLLAGGVAHDFSNLLTPIVGHVELMLARLPAGSPLADRALAIQSAAQRATELVRQLMVYAGRGEIERRPVDLNALALETVALLAGLDTPGSPFVLDLEPALPPVEADGSQLRQVLANLLANARDAVAGGPGTVSVVSRRIELGAAELGRMVLAEGLGPGPAVLLEVRDEGPGMDADTLARLWEPFFTTKPGGHGLGLPSLLGILRQHRAGLAVESSPGRGTRFRIAFALAPSPPAAPGAAGGAAAR